jgi:SET domain-containing protein
MEMNESDPRFCLKQSTTPGAGLGVFARLPLRKGDCLEVMGVRVKPGSVADACSAFADRHKFVHGDQLIIPLGYAGMVNHSATPNMVRHEQDGKLFLKALRDIAVDEELFHAYNATALRKMGLSS